MPHRRRRRCITTVLLVVSLLFSQLALARYVCPALADAAAMAAAMAAGAPCEGMDPAQPALCHAHAADAAQTVERAPSAAAAQPALVQVLALPALREPSAASVMPMVARPEARPPPDPPFLATRRLRV